MSPAESPALVWCPLCRVNFEVLDSGSVVSFHPQGVSIDPQGGVELGAPSETYLDYSHLVCGTKVRFDLVGAYEEPGAKEHMIEVDLPTGNHPVLMLGSHIVTQSSYLSGAVGESAGDDLLLDELDHRGLTSSFETLKLLRDSAYSKLHLLKEDTK